MSSYLSLPTAALLAQLERAGHAPEVALIMALFERRAEAEPLVLDLFRDSYDDDWPDDDPRWYRFIHAGRLLIAWGTEAALPTFADLYLDKPWPCLPTRGTTKRLSTAKPMKPSCTAR